MEHTGDQEWIHCTVGFLWLLFIAYTIFCSGSIFTWRVFQWQSGGSWTSAQHLQFFHHRNIFARYYGL